ncbi:hypothetical protein AC1031_016562 [Aphanomyces cochlioides]|nr:hypothetical protein AC1031_016592 [Aphanomyces cochlioides]KAG9397852.1 hypothetical protein AC1031_016562 [Aphanomyces cochlioides]
MRSVWSKLPQEVVVKISFFIQDANDLLAFLEDVQRDTDLGPLKQLYLLGKSNCAMDFWPSSWIVPWIQEVLSCYPNDSIAKYYSKITLEDDFDVEWIKRHVNPMAHFQWIVWTSEITLDDWKDLRIVFMTVDADAEDFGEIRWRELAPRLPHLIYLDWIVWTSEITLDDWKDLRIVFMTVDADAEDFGEIRWRELAPRLPHLIYLDVKGASGDLSGVFQFVASSNQITQFGIYVEETYTMKTSDVIHLILWFKTRSVERFEFMSGDLSAVDEDLKQALYQAMFNCSTLETLRLSYEDSNNMDFSRLTFSMKLLQLHIESMASSFVKSLASRLERSSVTRLDPGSYESENLEGMVSLLQVLPRTSVKHLELTL